MNARNGWNAARLASYRPLQRERKVLRPVGSETINRMVGNPSDLERACLGCGVIICDCWRRNEGNAHWANNVMRRGGCVSDDHFTYALRHTILCYWNVDRLWVPLELDELDDNSLTYRRVAEPKPRVDAVSSAAPVALRTTVERELARLREHLDVDPEESAPAVGSPAWAQAVIELGGTVVVEGAPDNLKNLLGLRYRLSGTTLLKAVDDTGRWFTSSRAALTEVIFEDCSFGAVE